MALKPIHWILITTSALFIPLTIMFLITRIFMNPKGSWWWFFGLLIIQAVIGLVVGTIIFISNIKGSSPPKQRISPKDAKTKAIKELKHDTDNPDNFLVLNQRILKVGEPGKPRTPILWLNGKGTELNQRKDAVINLDAPKVEISWHTNATDHEVKESIRLMAENPETEEKEERKIGIDEYGRPQTTIVTRKVSQADKEATEEQKEAEAQNIY